MDIKKSQNFQHLESELSSEACGLYKALTGHYPNVTDCQFLSANELAFIFEDFITPTEQLFQNRGLHVLAQEVRRNLDKIFDQELIDIVHSHTQRSIHDILSTSSINTGHKSVILVLAPELTV